MGSHARAFLTAPATVPAGSVSAIPSLLMPAILRDGRFAVHRTMSVDLAEMDREPIHSCRGFRTSTHGIVALVAKPRLRADSRS
jgi:hypothetical protein